MRLRSVWTALPAIATLFCVTPAAAQTPAAGATPKPTPAAAPVPTIAPASAAAAMELFKVMKMQATMQDTSAAMIQSEIARNPGIAAFREVMLGWLRKYMTWDAMLPELTRLYTQIFSDAELREMTAFYKTPTGQKALAKMPELMQRTAMLGARLGQPHTEELKAAMSAKSEELKKEQEKAQAKAGTPAPGKTPAARPTTAPKKP